MPMALPNPLNPKCRCFKWMSPLHCRAVAPRNRYAQTNSARQSPTLPAGSATPGRGLMRSTASAPSSDVLPRAGAGSTPMK